MFNYDILVQNKIVLLAYLFLALAIISLWVKRHYFIWMSLLSLGIISGLLTQRITLLGIFSILLLGVLYYFTYNNKKLSVRIVCGIIALLCSLLFFLHLVPGFNNFEILHSIQLTSDAIPYSLYLNFDKPLVGLFILAFGWITINGNNFYRKNILLIILLFILTVCTLMSLSFYMNYIKFEPKWNNLFYIWAFINLLFTCVTEEALFRGFIQRNLFNSWKNFSYAAPLSILIAAIFFGLLHFQGGISYIIISAIAGLFYGTAYHLTQRIEASILMHFMVNTTHFLLFTYPALANNNVGG